MSIDITQYPEPDVLEDLDYEAALLQIQLEFLRQFPENAIEAAEAGVPARDKMELLLGIEGNLVTKQLQAFAYHAVALRARVNDAAKATFLAYATGTDLDILGAFYGVVRRVVVEADPEAEPPIEAEYETDTVLRDRIILAIDGFSVAGPAGAYRFHALSSSGQVKDVRVYSPTPGVVTVTVMSTEGDGEPDVGLLAIVDDALNAEDIRPLTDSVVVQSCTAVEYAITAALTLYPEANSDDVLSKANTAVEAYVESMRLLGYDVTMSGLYGALHQPGVQSVAISSPAASVVIDDDEVAYCTAITITEAGTDV